MTDEIRRRVIASHVQTIRNELGRACAAEDIDTARHCAYVALEELAQLAEAIRE